MLNEITPVTIVDDSKDIRNLVSIVLDRECSVQCLGLGSFSDLMMWSEDVLASKVVILDIHLGENQPDGIEIADWLLMNDFKGKIVILTGYGTGNPRVQRAIEMGFPVLLKPFPAHELAESINQHLAAPRA